MFLGIFRAESDLIRFDLCGSLCQIASSSALYKAAAIILFLALTSCGGGGSAGGNSEVVVSQNSAPAFTVAVELTVLENTLKVATITTTDPDGDSISLSLTGGADRELFALTGDDELIFLTDPDFEQPQDSDLNNIYEVQITASDGQKSASQLFSIEVTDLAEVANQIPKATDNSAELSKYASFPISGNIITDDDGFGVDTDDDGDSIEISSVSGGGQYGALTYDVSGSYSYKVDNTLPSVLSLTSQETLIETYSYTITDGISVSDSAKLIITILGRSSPEFLVSNDLTVFENSTEVLFLETRDADGDDVSLSITGGDDRSAFEINADNFLVFRSAPDYESPVDSDANNTYVVEVSASDFEASTQLLLSVRVLDVAESLNRAPVAIDNFKEISEDDMSLVSGNMIIDDDGFGADNDPDNDSLTVSELIGGNRYGTLSYSSSGSYTYRLNNDLEVVQALEEGQTLTETYRYRVTDGSLQSPQAELRFKIQGKNESDDIAFSIQFPAPGSSLIGNELTTVVTITSIYELKSVTATIAGITTPLVYSEDPVCIDSRCRSGFSSIIDLRSQPSGDYTLVIEATDSRGITNSIQRSVTLDRPPELIVNAPIALSVSRGDLVLEADCSDQEGACAVNVSIFCGVDIAIYQCAFQKTQTSTLSEVAEVSEYDNFQLTVRFKATDGAGQTITDERVVTVETSPLIEAVSSVRGEILDFDSTRILYNFDGDYFIHLTDTGVSTRIDLPSDLRLYEGFLTPRGAFLSLTSDSVLDARLYDFNDGALYELDTPNGAFSSSGSGNYIVYNTNGNAGSGGRLIRRNLETKTNTIISENAGNNENDVNDDGQVVFWSRDYQIVSSSGGTETIVASDADLWATYPINGIDKIVYRLHDPCCSNQRYSLRLIQNGSDTLLSDFRSLNVSPGADYAINGEWVAFTDAGSAGQSQVWTLDPTGRKLQRSDFGTGSSIAALAMDGDLLFVNGSTHLLSAPSGQYLDTEVSRGQIGVAHKINGKWFVSIGRELFVVPLW